MKIKLFTALFAMIVLSLNLTAAEVSVFDADINSGDKTYWTNDNVYVLEEMVFVEEGAELYIQEGTVIKGKEGQKEDSKALVICRGAKIFAEGTPNKPIIFTAYADDPYSMTDLPLTETGLWGGVIILGKSVTNNTSGEKNIEGIDENEPRGKYGVADGEGDPHDNSGVVRYASIRHGGTDIGDGNEINGLSLGAVGDGTTIEYVEVWYNKDDGFEFFGGTVNARYLVSAYNGDDSFDYDEGFNGKGQFWFSIQAENRGGNAGEHDGGNKPDDSEPYARPEIYNVTYIGSGLNSENTGKDGSKGFLIRDNAGGKYYNSIFMDTPDLGLEVEDLESGHDSRERLETGDLVFNNNIWWNVGGETTTVETISPDAEKYSQDFVRSYLADANNNNWIVDPQIMSISRNIANPDGGLDPRPAYGSPAFTNATAPVPTNGFFEAADYIGAFGPGNLWIDHWTLLSQAGIMKELRKTEVSVSDADINAGDMVTWTSDNVYVLEDMVFVEEGATLKIEPGTVIKGKEGQKEDSKALVICRGAKIMAEGTPVQPIIFTAYADDPYSVTDLPLTETGLWGGVLILGKSITNNVSGEKNIEGIDENEPRGKYGVADGAGDPHDNSGVFKYCQIRHGGTDIGDGNEINGLSMGAVGDGTVIENVEVWYNKDDGFEFFGGTVNTRFLVSAFNGDDSFDYDEGFSGKGQFWFSIQAANRGGNAGEHDGGNKPDDATPYAIPYVYNVTYIGSGVNSENTGKDGSKIFLLRDNAGGKYFNNIFMDTPDLGADIEDLESGHDSRERLEQGDLKLQGNIWWHIGSETTTVETISPDAEKYTQDFVREYLSNADNKNVIVDPKLYGISRNVITPDGGLDPRPMMESPAWTADRMPVYGVNNTFFAVAEYNGAFGHYNWLSDWTFLSQAGVTGGMAGRNPMIELATGVDEPTSVEEQPIENNGENGISNYPNPFEETTEIQFYVSEYSNVEVTVFNSMGQEVETLVNKTLAPGLYGAKWTVNNLPAGAYIVRMVNGNTVKTHKIILK